MQILSDGSVRVEPSDQLTPGFVKKWKQDKDDPMVFRLRWPECPKRQLQVITLPCGKKQSDWTCSQFGIGVSPSICEECSEKPVSK